MTETTRERLVPVLVEYMCEVTGLPRDGLRPDTSFDEIGLQSLSVVAFTRRLEAHFPHLPRTFLFDCRDLNEVAAYLSGRFPAETQKLLAAAPTPPLGRGSDEGADPEWPDLVPLEGVPAAGEEMSAAGFAVVGMEGRFPGAGCLREFWRNLKEGVDAVTEIPRDRWDLDGFFEPSDGRRHPGRSYSKWGAFLADVDRFDAKFFGIAPREAALMDPQERLFLEASWHAMEDAGLLGERAAYLKGDNGYDIGVFLGLTTNTYALKGPDHWRKGHPEIPTSMPWSAANRVSYFLDLSGPSLTVDTACSSSLVAIHLACESLERGECKAAIAGGVNLYLHPAKYIQLCQQQMLSPTGRCHSFGADADGFTPGEGVGVLVLKRLQDALRHRDRILAVVRGTAVNHNGRTNGYTVPKAKSQAALVREALVRAGVSPASISYVEAHGTGTKLGDPIEVSGLADALGGKEAGGPCALGSVKSNIGHLESAAGVAGVIKTILQLEHGTIAPSLHSATLNPALDLENTRFFVPQEARPWLPTEAGPRRAGVSSFGAGGTNAHVIIEEAPDADRCPAEPDGPMVFPLSARRRCALDKAVRALLSQLEALDEESEREALARLAYTLQCARRHFEHRLAFVADGKDALLAQVRAYVAADTGDGARRAADAGASPHVGFHTQPEAPPEDVRDASALAKAWVKGAAITWQALWPAEAPLPTDAPKYAFLKERHWLSADESERVEAPSGGIAARGIIRIPSHSILFKEHVIGGRPLLPATASIALCHALASAGPAQKGVVEFRDLTWLRPVAAPGEGDVAIEYTSNDSNEHLEIELRDARQPHEVCFRAVVRPCPPEERLPALSLAEARALCSAEVDVSECYLRFERAGMAYGPCFRCLDAAWIRDGAALAKIRQREEGSAAALQTPLDPAMMDGVLHTANFLLDHANGEFEAPLVPISAKRIAIMETPRREVFAYVRRKRSSSKDEVIFDFWVFSPEGRILIEIEEFRYRRVLTATLADRAGAGVHCLVPKWVETTGVEAGREPDPAILFDTDTRVFDRIRTSAPEIAAVTQLAVSAASFEVHDNEDIEWDPTRHLDLLKRALASSRRTPRRLVFHIRSVGEEDLSSSARPARGSTLEAIEILRAFCRSAPAPRLHVSMVVDHCDSGGSGALGGLLRSIVLELPTLSASVLVVEDGDSTKAVIEELRAPPRQGLVEARLKAGRRYEKRLEFLSELSSGDGSPVFNAKDVFIITGASGAIGRSLALRLSQKGVGRFVLIGRSGRGEKKVTALIRDLTRNGATAEYWQADCSDREALEQALTEARRVFGPPTGIVHCAGILKDGFFVRQSVEDLREACRAKVLGAHFLDHLTADCPIRWFVLCSALAGIRGNIGQSHYAFANTWIDSFAECRAEKVLRGKRSGKSISIAWPHWSLADGMQASPRLLEQLHEVGIHPIDEADAEKILWSALAGSSPVVIPVKGKRADIERFFELGQTLPARSPSPPTGPQPKSFEHVPEQEDVEDALLDVLAQAVGAVTGSEPARMDPDAPMEVYGLDSIMVMELNGLLEKHFPTLSKTAAFEARSLRGLAQLIAGEHPEEARRLVPKEPASERRVSAEGESQRVHTEGSSQPASHPNERSRECSNDIAIIGLAGRYPGAETLDDFWQALASGKDLVTPIPKRWRKSEFGFGTPNQEESIYARWGGFLDDFDKFDPLFFGISPRDAERMDPQERLFLETAWHAVEDAGYTPEQLSGRRGKGRRRRVSVVVGVMYGEYQFFGAAAPPGSSVPLTNSSYASIANRVSFCLDFDGPSLAVDSMCSSSLYAIHIASELIRSGSCDVAIAGGVNLSLHHYKYRTLCELGFASSDGKCRSFGDGGDGYVPGEGVGAVVLKPAHMAIRDKDHIYGIIRGSDIGHGGRGSGYTVPNAEAQADVIRGAFDRADIDPARLGYIEAHGTGTSLGDPIEIRGLSKALSKSLPPGKKCPIGSVKSNVGHLESAAGIAGLTKILLQIKHGKIAPSLHSGTLNRNIDFSSTPFYVQTELADWAHDGAPRIAALSSFGAGGSNAHMVIEEYWPPIEPPSTAAGEELFVFSARSWKQLAVYLDRFMSFLEREAVSDTWLGRLGYSTAEVAATLRHGRRHHRARCAVVARDFNGLYLELKSCLGRLESLRDEGTSHVSVSPGAFLGEVQEGLLADKAAVAALREHASAWVTGQWTIPEDAAPPLRKVPLPGYAFERNRYWIWDLSVEQEAPQQLAELQSSPIVLDEEITPEAILEKVDRGVMDVADAQEILNRLLAAEAAG